MREWHGVATDANGRLHRTQGKRTQWACVSRKRLRGTYRRSWLTCRVNHAPLSGNELRAPYRRNWPPVLDLQRLSLWENQLTGPASLAGRPDQPGMVEPPGEPAGWGDTLRVGTSLQFEGALNLGQPVDGPRSYLAGRPDHLESLHLYNNQLTGPIPHQWAT